MQTAAEGTTTVKVSDTTMLKRGQLFVPKKNIPVFLRKT